MDPPSSSHFHHTSCPQLGYTWARNDVMVHWLQPPDPCERVSTSTLSIYKVFENIHIWWKGRGIHHHSTSTIPVGPKFRKLVEFLVHSWAANDVKMHWLRPQTSMDVIVVGFEPSLSHHYSLFLCWSYAFSICPNIGIKLRVSFCIIGLELLNIIWAFYLQD